LAVNGLLLDPQAALEPGGITDGNDETFTLSRVIVPSVPGEDKLSEK
jgi:hypothetical protein